MTDPRDDPRYIRMIGLTLLAALLVVASCQVEQPPTGIPGVEEPSPTTDAPAPVRTVYVPAPVRTVYVPAPVRYAGPPAQARPLPPGCLMIREYQTRLTVGGRQVEAYGDTCLQADGSWRRFAPKLVPE